jgi:hypothetical protein
VVGKQLPTRRSIQMKRLRLSVKGLVVSLEDIHPAFGPDSRIDTRSDSVVHAPFESHHARPGKYSTISHANPPLDIFRHSEARVELQYLASSKQYL